MNQALQYLDLFNFNKQQIAEFVEQVSSTVEARKSLPLLYRLTVLEKIIDGVKAAIKDQMLEEADLEGQKTFTINGVRFEKKGKPTYYYNHCAKWNDLKAQIKSLEDMMKAAKEPFADPQTGEIIEPARSSYTEYITVTIP